MMMHDTEEMMERLENRVADQSLLLSQTLPPPVSGDYFNILVLTPTGQFRQVRCNHQPTIKE